MTCDTSCDVQDKVYAGYAKAARKLGLPYGIYRPNGANDPIAQANFVENEFAAFTTHTSAEYNFSKPMDHKHALSHALVDGRRLAVGYYLVHAELTFFVAAMQRLAPILAVNCNRVVTIGRKLPHAELGLQPAYGSTNRETDETLAANWPASVRMSSKSQGDQASFNTVGEGSWNMLLPTIEGLRLFPGDIVVDDLGFRFIVQVAENTAFGWSVQMQQQTV